MSSPQPTGGTDSTEDLDAWRDDEPAPQHLSTGPWTMTVRGVSVDDIGYGGVPVLSALRVVVRDHDWRTVPVTSCSVDVREAGDQRLHVVLSATHDDLGAGVQWRSELTAEGNRLRLAVAGEVTRPFRRNRMGLVVLHPVDVAGTVLRVRHPDGSATTTAFPRDIAPHQPAEDVAGLDWTSETTDGVLDVSLDLHGEVFEMEDQRNWTDASFKTYSTPLTEPFPVPVVAGDGFEHVAEVVVAPAGPPPAAAGETTAGEPLAVLLDPLSTGAHPAPRLQLQASTAPGGVPRLEALEWRGPLLVELDATGRAWPGVLARAGREADLLGGAGLDVRITARDGADLDPVLVALRRYRVERVAAYDGVGHVTTPALWRHLRERAVELSVDLPLAGGTRAHFTELNRRRQDLPADLPAWTFSSTPQMHDTGRRQLLQAVAVQRQTAEQAVRLAGARPVHVGPVTLRARFNAVATSGRHDEDADVVAAGTGPQHVWAADDPRQAGHGFAAWLIASYQAFAVPGVASVTFAETWGPRGVVSVAGEPFPAAQSVGWLAALDGWDLLPCPLVPGLGLVAARRAGRLVVLAADLTGRGRRVRAGGLDLVVGPWGTARGEGSASGGAPVDQPASTPSVRG
ncbi:hypothetical protein [Kineococcus rhizosphaerae]|uniref:hypothetical protein n=1 Tax=Kineococcus rhizosphaerae TaxID=559628 RepID=UPI0011B1E553|nr:hypothetical protein [Kineococcus rhizosphaerae]